MRKYTPVPRHPNIYEYDTAKGKRYRVRRTFNNSVGKRDEFSRSGIRTWRQADAVLKQFEADLSAGKYNQIAGAEITVDQYYQRITKRKVELGVWKSSTAKNNNNYYKHYLQPAFGSSRLSDVSRPSYQSFLDSLTLKGLARTTVRTVNALMLMIMNDAEEQDVIPKNKLKGMLIRGRDASDKDIDPEDYERWIDVAQHTLDKYMMALIYLDTLGLRRGELMGLRTESFEFRKDKAGKEICGIKIDLQRTIDFPTGGTLKTKSSYRTVWVSGEVIDYIKFAILTADNIRTRNNIPDSTQKWLWLNDNGEPLHPNHPNRVMRRVEKESNIHITPHMLRHYFATQASASKSAPIEIMHWLGHSNVQMTADYTRPTIGASLSVYSSVAAKLQDTNDNSNPYGTK